MAMKSIATQIIEESRNVADACLAAVPRMVDRLITGSEMKIVYEFSDDSVLVVNFNEQRMTAA